jgi:transposase
MSTIPGVSLSGGVRVLIAAKPVDFRKGANGLAALAKEVLAQDPFSGAIIVFRAKRADRVKILLWDGSGLMLVWKRLEQGGFKWPPIMDGVMQLSPAQLADRGTGLDTRARAGGSAADSCAIGAVK